MTTEALVLKQFGLPATVNFSQAVNAFISQGYTSMAGNTYFNAVRFAEGVVIKEDVGQGYCRSFLNGLRIYSLKDKTLLVDRKYNSFFYNKYAIKQEIEEMLFGLLKDAAEREGYLLDAVQARSIINRIADSAMNDDQQQMLQAQTAKYLSK